MPGAAAQATMHDFVRRPLAETQQPQGHGVQGARSRERSLCDDAAELSVDGMRLRRDRVQHWVFPQSKDYPCVENLAQCTGHVPWQVPLA